MTHLKVAVRVRPLSQRELSDNPVPILSIENSKTVAITNLKVPEQNAGDSRERTRRFTFDFCFNENSSQDDVFRAIESVVGKSIKNRYHSCVLAYGQSSSGKTHTMMGFPHDPGLIPRLCERIFHYIQDTAVENEIREMKTTVSYLEIYNEKVRDLLGGSSNLSLRVREHPKKGPYVQGLSEHTVKDYNSLLELLNLGTSNRCVAETITNPESSRSHSVFTINCSGVKLNLIDLAGSERAENRCYGTSRFLEGSNINKSLVALGNVISALAEHQSKVVKRFVPYRDSVLTWLLKDTLGGNSNTVMIATISPSSTCYSETVNTLRFGQRAKLIVYTPVVNEDPKEKTIRELRAEIARLRELLNNHKFPVISDIHFNNNEIEMATNTNSKETIKPKPTQAANNILRTEQLIPVMDITTSVNNNKKEIPIMRRTSSSQALNKNKNNQTLYGSQESIRKRSIDSSNSSTLKKIVQKKSLNSSNEKIVETKAKVDSRRPRSQIVAAVTNRLYAKTKKRDISTDTDDINQTILPKELSICSNARFRLKEITKKALKAHRNRNEETQTDLFPVLRVKEVSTDVFDLKIDVAEMRNVEINTDIIKFKHKAVGCFLNNFNTKTTGAILLTRTCGTQSVFSTYQEESKPPPPSISFTKYLMKDSTSKTPSSSAVFTSSVNININPKLCDSSDDSLDEPMCLQPAPDLISNHNNSLDEITNKKLQENENKFLVDQKLLHQDDSDKFLKTSVKELTINIPNEICLNKEYDDDVCQHFLENHPKPLKPKIIKENPLISDCVKLSEPLVLKSIMKHNIDDSVYHELPDSLEYHKTNKNVRFNNKQHDRMCKAMSEFLEEATNLMSNLRMTADRLGALSDLDLKITLNEVIDQKRKRKHYHTQSTKQTFNASTSEELTFNLATNKYEILLEDSCRRLEEKIKPNLWDLSNNEDTSLDSNGGVTFSDYGSLPRRRKNQSPSVFLRHLTNLRKRVVENSCKGVDLNHV